EAYQLVLDGAGATLPRRDAVDRRVIENVRTGKATARRSRDDLHEFLKRVRYNDDLINRNIALIEGGIIMDPNDVGGYPDYHGEPYTDTDGDGLPDAWETAHGLNPHDPADAIQSPGENQYTPIECFIHGINPRNQPDWTNLKNNIDRASMPGRPAGVEAAPADHPGMLRARAVTAALTLPDPAAADRVEALISNYYVALHDILGARQRTLDAIETAGEKNDAAVTEAYAIAKAQYVPRRLALLANLALVVDQPTIEQIKDAMTGGVMLQTYRNYIDMAPALTDVEKAQIYAWMLEARENALDAFTSKQQHQWFAKYRGKINNYIVAQGYDFKTLSSEWAARNNRPKGP
ncbi:MAG TPA: DUF3826 domain-containing protein, partial [Tepidisphaeraceae bacterium]|nr:DUF3826 domain-containing protein [Tepidisphaeraceae bacterium]